MSLVWKRLSEDEIISIGRRKLQSRIYLLPDGTEKEFVLMIGGRTVCTVAITTEGKIILAKQYRPGQERILWELPGGGIGEHEEPRVAAERELLEETGYKVGTIEFLGKFPVDAYSTREAYFFFATNCEKIQAQTLDESEFIETVEVTKEEFAEHILSGDMTDISAALLGLRKLESELSQL